ncbi:hypothetical protein PIB30_053067 [Stylosanthes scabra]|uniref:Uncharacterized protein n=1 Tax=Stylosanthes scabra TaxID=79078 RepID=A0ABU6WHZ4_9FABA|nr:hypothetical protein [Stylosanthes scabra]
MISDILLDGDGGYRPDIQFDGSQVHVDLNEPVSGPSHVFMADAGNPYGISNFHRQVHRIVSSNKELLAELGLGLLGEEVESRFGP